MSRSRPTTARAWPSPLAVLFRCLNQGQEPTRERAKRLLLLIRSVAGLHQLVKQDAVVREPGDKEIECGLEVLILGHHIELAATQYESIALSPAKRIRQNIIPMQARNKD